MEIFKEILVPKKVFNTEKIKKGDYVVWVKIQLKKV